MRRISFILLVLSSVVSCVLEIVESPQMEPSVPGVARVTFSPQVYPSNVDAASEETRSSVSPDEDLIADINVFAYMGGLLVAQTYSVDVYDVALDLPIGCVCDVYAVANMGQIEAPASEATFSEKFSYKLRDMSDLNKCMPMACFSENVYVGKSTRNLTLIMERLAAKFVLSVEKESLLEGLCINSVRMFQCASVVKPFKWIGNGGSRAESVREIMEGDYATDSDLARLNSGNEIVFYALENCQGVLLPNNTDPFLKTPQLLASKRNLCTYFDIVCSFDGTGLLGGDVTYRIYAGLDDCKSFDVPGNSCIDISLALTDEALKRVSWKVKADVYVMDGYARGCVLQGMHGMSELYVGEKLLYQVEISEELLEYLGGSASGCTLGYVSSASDDSGAGVSISGVNVEGNLLTAEVLCDAPTSGELYLYSQDGVPLGCLERNVVVNVPKIVLSEYAGWSADEPVESMTFVPESEVNGSSVQMYVYFTDAQGHNLNGNGSYGFDSSLFDLKDGGAYAGGVQLKSVTASFAMLPDAPGSAAALMRVSCRNDGLSHTENVLLSDIYSMEKNLRLNVVEANYETVADIGLGLCIPEVKLSLVDNGWAGYHDTQLSVIVDNPSNLPLEVSVWQLVSTYSAVGPSDQEYVENNLHLDHIQYVTGRYYNGEPPYYASCSGFYSERTTEGDPALRDGSRLVYPLRGISTGDIIKAVNYGGRKGKQMIHLLDARLAGRKFRAGDLILHDNVSDGSSTYDYLYYSNDSWNYQGATLYTAGQKVAESGTWTHDYPNVAPLTLDRLCARYHQDGDACVEFMFAPHYGKLTVATYAGEGDQYGLTLSLDYEGTMDGYVKTYPKGTWYAAQDNYCSVDFAHEKSGVQLTVSGQYVWADDGQLKAAMNEIYEFSYKDSPKPLGADSYMHKAHPTEVEMDISLLVEGDKGKELYPYYTRWKYDFLEFYHIQEEATYECTVNADASGYFLTVVSHR